MSWAKTQSDNSLGFHLEIVMDRSQKMDKPRPYVTAALLCERVLQEKDGSLTLVRIAEKLQYRLDMFGPDMPKSVKPMIPIQGLISIKSGPVTGDHVIKISVEKPGSKPGSERKDAFTQPVTLLGGDQGQNIILNIGLGVESDGLYWLDVIFDEEVLTRIPLMVTALPPLESQEQKA
jgi:hypothetical protein